MLLAHERWGVYKRGNGVAGMGFWGVPFGPARVRVAGTCDPHVGGTLATEGCCALVESLVLDPEPASFLLFWQGGSLGPVLATGVLGFLGKNA